MRSVSAEWMKGDLPLDIAPANCPLSVCRRMRQAAKGFVYWVHLCAHCWVLVVDDSHFAAMVGRKCLWSPYCRAANCC